METKKVLITGGCGFIGSNLVEFLLQKTDWQLVILDNLTNGSLKDIEVLDRFQERCTFVEGDIRNSDNISKAMDGCNFVVNLAAQAGVMTSIEDPKNDADINVIGTLNVLKACVDKKISKIVHASSAAPLGDQEMPLSEKKVPKPLSPYGASKLACEAYCSAFSASYGLNTVVLRFSNVYGPKSYQKGSVIPLFIKQILNKEEVSIYGDGNQTRDFIYVSDICNAIFLSLTTDLDNKSELFQIATSTETSINKFFETLKLTFEEKDIEVKDASYKEQRPGEVMRNYADISKAKSTLGFNPEIELKQGLKNTVKWFLNNKA